MVQVTVIRTSTGWFEFCFSVKIWQRFSGRTGIDFFSSGNVALQIFFYSYSPPFSLTELKECKGLLRLLCVPLQFSIFLDLFIYYSITDPSSQLGGFGLSGRGKFDIGFHRVIFGGRSPGSLFLLDSSRFDCSCTLLLSGESSVLCCLFAAV